MFKKLLREPLLHFLLIGAALFFIYGLQNEQPADNDNRIVINSSDINRLISLWQKKWLRPPTQTELDGMIRAQVREEVLYREALAMGLDKNDSVVRRRLAQKIEFIFSDLAAQVEPGEIELADYLANNADKFERPSRISFLQIYLNADKRGTQLLSDAKKLMHSLTQQNSSLDILTAGDPFMFGQQHKQLSEQDVSRLFGKDFTRTTFKLTPGKWQGPVASSYGLHLIKITENIPASLPELNVVRGKVLNEWHSEQRRKMDEDFYTKLKTPYEIVIDKAGVKQELASSTASETRQ